MKYTITLTIGIMLCISSFCQDKNWEIVFKQGEKKVYLHKKIIPSNDGYVHNWMMITHAEGIVLNRKLYKYPTAKMLVVYDCANYKSGVL